MNNQLDYKVTRLPSGDVYLEVMENASTLTPQEAMDLGRLLMGAGGFPSYRDDEPWASDNRRRIMEAKK